MRDDQNEIEVNEIHEVLSCIRQQHDNAAAPWLKRLADIQAMRGSPSIYIADEQAVLLQQSPDEGDVINRIGPDASESEKNRLSLALTQMNAEMEIMRTQTAVNAAEAASSSLFVAGWRPAIGWICVASLGYQYVIYPVLLWSGMLVPNFVPPQPVVSDVLIELLFGMLGLAGLRTVEKLKGVKK